MEDNNQLKFEPKKTNRFFFEFPKDFEINSYLVKECERPVYNREKNKWSKMFITLYDIVGTNVTKQLIKVSRQSKEEFKFKLIMVNAFGDEIETWEIYGVICEISLNHLDHQIDEFSKIKAVIDVFDVKFI